MKTRTCTALLVAGLAAGCVGQSNSANTSSQESVTTAALNGWGSRYVHFRGAQQSPNHDVALLIKVKSALGGTPELRPFSIEVGVLNGVVTLYGQVDTAERRVIAERVAIEVRGVASVKSGIAVTSPV